MSDAQIKPLTELLNKLQTLSVPRCESAADELAYVACRDEIIHDALQCIGGSVSSTEPLHFVSVNEQALAQLVLTRTFDSHKDVLRQQVKAAQQEAERWKAIALAVEPDAATKFATLSTGDILDSAPNQVKPLGMDCSTQTDVHESEPPSHDVVFFGADTEWSENCLEQIVSSLDKKINVLVETIGVLSCSSSNTIPPSSRQCDSGDPEAVRGEVRKGVDRRRRTSATVAVTSQRKSERKEVPLSQKQTFDRLAVRHSPAVKSSVMASEVPAPQQHDEFLYAIRPMPLQNARPKKSGETKLPSLTRKRDARSAQ